MKFSRWLALLCVYVVFMIGGAVMFLYLEHEFESRGRQELFALKLEVMEVVGGLDNASRPLVERVLEDVGGQCGHDFLHEGVDAPLIWTLWNSFFFTFTVITTIGFGHMAPKTPWGRMACILYAFIGVPLNGILITKLADIFSNKVMSWDVRQWATRYKTWARVLVDSIVFLVPGLVVFLILPSLILMAVEEGWSYLDAFYFSFITLTTIGFGDKVAGQQARDHVGVWVYKIVMVIWIIFGLGYIIMIITYVQKVLKSKQIHMLEKKMATAMKKHIVRVHTDLGAVRRAINNNNNNKINPEEIEVIEKSELGAPPDHPHHAHSHPQPPFTRPRSASESDLFMPSKAHSQELEGMNAMLDFIERLLHHEETEALSNLNQLLYHHHHCPDATDEAQQHNTGVRSGIETAQQQHTGVRSGIKEAQQHTGVRSGIKAAQQHNIGGRSGITLEGGCDNCGFEADINDLTGLELLQEEEKSEKKDTEPGMKCHTRTRRKSYADDLLYLRLMRQRGQTTTSTSQQPSPTSPTNNPLNPHLNPTSHNPLTLTQYFQRVKRANNSSHFSGVLRRLGSVETKSPVPLKTVATIRATEEELSGAEKEFTKL